LIALVLTPNNNKQEIHKTKITNPNTNKLALVKHEEHTQKPNAKTVHL